MADADAAAERALKVARAIKDGFKPVAQSSAPYKLADIGLTRCRSTPIKLR